MNFDWSELAFASKKPVRELNALFIAAPREMSDKRWKEIVKTYLPQGNLVVGIAKEPYVDGFAGQPQFKMDDGATIAAIAERASQAPGKHRISVLRYFQRELPHLIEKLGFQKVLLVNGSWQHVFHSSPAYFALTTKQLAYELISPFINEQEARDYEQRTDQEILARLDATGTARKKNSACSEEELLRIATLNAQRSYDYGFQTGLALGRQIKEKNDQYSFLISTFNKVVPYQTFAMLHGASRETNFSPPNDLNHYDTIHAEVELLIQAQKAGADLKGTTLFINLMPCPSCARMFTETDIEEFVYSIDHSDGYAVKMLEAAGKRVRRVVL